MYSFTLLVSLIELFAGLMMIFSDLIDFVSFQVFDVVFLIISVDS